MTGLGRRRRWSSGLGVPVGIAALVTGVTVAGLTWASPGREPARAAPDDAGSAHAPRAVRSVPAVPARRTGAVRPERPTTSRLPNGTVVPIRPAWTATDGSLAVPDDIRVAGWWRGGSRLGDPFGATLLAAHVDSLTQGLGPYASLLSARAGQRIVVASGHLTQTFAVVSLRLVPRPTLPEHRRLFSARGDRRLVLVTCAGPYDAHRGGYQNLAVITAVPTTDVQPRSAR
jgi:hypothetical protein